MNLVIDEIQYHVESCGEGFPLMALHGFTGNGATWLPFCEVWGQHSRLIMPDIIGHGQTDSPKEIRRYDIVAAAKDLSVLLDKMGIAKVDLLGYSMGGRLAITFAVLFPEKVRKLVLESASAGLEEEHLRSDRRMKDGQLANLILEKGIQHFVRYWEGIPLFSSLEKLPPQTKEAIRAQRLNNSSIGLSNSLVGMGTGSQPSWWRDLAMVPCEVLMITGKKDEKFCRIAEQMLSHFQNGRMYVIEDAGHIIHVEESEKFGTIVSEFLSNT
jgi:2-succinyl-6-hydroxy-2,4-cyclohexadiene-1-carboxylate synthase